MAKAVSRIVDVRDGVIGPGEPRNSVVVPRRLSDFPGTSQAHLEVAKKLSNPLLMGPPICNEFVAFVEHLFTEDEAAVACHLGMTKKSAATVARSAGLPQDKVEEIMRSLGTDKHCINKSGGAGQEKYSLMPVFPGIFEMVLIGKDPEALNDWDRKFAELFEDLYMTGYWLVDDTKMGPGMVRYLPVAESVAANPMALPTDKLEPVLEPFSIFGVGHCQCRTSAQVEGKGCGKPTLNCLVMGEIAQGGIRDGWLQKVTRAEALEIKREAESHGMVNWMMNVAAYKSQSSCSCCGCCCHNFRMISEFGAPGMIAPPHFLPAFDAAACNYCGKCALACPMAALVIDTKEKKREHLGARCIGCGLCVLACDKAKATTMKPVDEYKGPVKSVGRLFALSMPGQVRATFKTWRGRRGAS